MGFLRPSTVAKRRDRFQLQSYRAAPHLSCTCPAWAKARSATFWLRGFTDWAAFPRRTSGGRLADLILGHLDDATAAHAFPRREAWRLADEYPGHTLFLDIETTGLSFDGTP